MCPAAHFMYDCGSPPLTIELQTKATSVHVHTSVCVCLYLQPLTFFIRELPKFVCIGTYIRLSSERESPRDERVGKGD